MRIAVKRLLLMCFLAGCRAPDVPSPGPCDAYLTCLEQASQAAGANATVVQDALAQARAQYGSGGACSASADARVACDQSCTQALTQAKTLYPGAPACSGPANQPDGGASTIDLTALSSINRGASIDLAFRLRNVSSPAPVVLIPAYFSVEDSAHRLYKADYFEVGGDCPSDSQGPTLAAGGQASCTLIVEGVSQPRTLTYSDGVRQASTPVGTTTVEGENTAQACTDGIDNDLDHHIDCDDYDCCALVACPQGTACYGR